MTIYSLDILISQLETGLLFHVQFSNCCFLTCIQISQEIDQVVWYSHHIWPHQMVDTEIRLIIFFTAKDGEALYSQQKQDWELTVVQIMNSLLSNSD